MSLDDIIKQKRKTNRGGRGRRGRGGGGGSIGRGRGGRGISKNRSTPYSRVSVTNFRIELYDAVNPRFANI